MINIDPNVRTVLANVQSPMPNAQNAGEPKSGFLNAVETAGKYVSKVDDLQQAADTSIQDLLTGKNNDVTAVVSAVAKADVSFKVLVGVRNKLIEAYKQTMNMQV
ncbi:MAG: flagellar hook-basal body complex protein FliE [Planctomycetes bacterium RBG_13_62_9]|nr:MAG: flagellar hook-basal body complex protein FliE [Planctomycetes bacterium RBG_13_62_9]